MDTTVMLRIKSGFITPIFYEFFKHFAKKSVKNMWWGGGGGGGGLDKVTSRGKSVSDGIYFFNIKTQIITL